MTPAAFRVILLFVGKNKTNDEDILQEGRFRKDNTVE